MAANTNTLAPVPADQPRDPRKAPTFLSAGVVMEGDLIEWDGRAYTVLGGHTGPRTRQLTLLDMRTGAERTIRPRRELPIRLLRDRRPNAWAA